MLRILALAGFVMSGLVGFWQIAVGSVSPATPIFLIAMSVAFIFLFAGLGRSEDSIRAAQESGGRLSAANMVFADLLKQALELKITEKDISVAVGVQKKVMDNGDMYLYNEVSVKPISDIGKQAFEEIQNRLSDNLKKSRVLGTRSGVPR